jgi:flavin reductase (DIM6/NTAB) family NADH-FMN oxidoreductase RutF
MATISDELRVAMRNWTSGVCVVCGNSKNEPYGMTVNSFTSVSLDPPLIVVTMNNSAKTKIIVKETGIFSVSVLNKDQQNIADIFSGKFPEIKNRFDGVDKIELPRGTVGINGSLVILECAVKQTIPFKTSTLFVGEVVQIFEGIACQPLVYHNRGYYSL